MATSGHSISNVRLSRGRVMAAIVTLTLAVSAGVIGATPADASDARCTTNNRIDCGMVYNTSGSAVRIATNFSPTYGDVVGTVSGVTATLPGNRSSDIFKDSNGRLYDWDAVYVPPKSCLYMMAGPGFGSTVDYRNTRSHGVWYKINNLGANVRALRSC
ncbi:hypothetical protein [Microbacterium testaceum]|uniref:hypothetical protein n=1 Tax=Microbacterium testaceum TaxID=2033 RepID=UPI000AAE2D07|nr:hypothetical protein [Microbacterium testaceum]